MQLYLVAQLLTEPAHELHHQTLTGFKRLMEMAASAGVVLSVLLIRHPKLRTTFAGRKWRRSATAPPPSSSKACPEMRTDPNSRRYDLLRTSAWDL